MNKEVQGSKCAQGANNKGHTGFDRRKFMQALLATVPAASLACCAFPRQAAGAAAPGEWVCLVSYLGESQGYHYYVAMNCNSNEQFVYGSDQSDLPLGSCTNPSQPECIKKEVWYGYRRTNDDLGIVMAPHLNQNQVLGIQNSVDEFKARFSNLPGA